MAYAPALDLTTLFEVICGNNTYGSFQQGRYSHKGCKQVTKRSTHARPGMYMQCSTVRQVTQLML